MKTKNILLTALLLCITGGAYGQTATTAPTPLITQSADKLVGVLKSNGTRKEKADACRELAVIGTSKAVPTLVGLLADDDLTHIARYALETIPGPGVDDALRGELSRLKGRTLVGVVGTIGVRQDTKAVKPLSSLLSDSDPQVAQAAARALGKIGTADAAQAIENALPKTTSPNRLAFYEGLFRCAETQASAGKTKAAIALYDRLLGLTDVPHQVRAGALRGAISDRGQDGLGLLKESLASSDRVVFNAAVRSSLEMTGSEVTRVLTASLPQLTLDNQIVVLQTLGSRGDERAVPALSTQAKTGATPTRLAAIRAVAAIGHSSAVAVMVELIEDSETVISQAATDGLAGMAGRETDAAVLDMLKSPKTNRRITGIDLAGRRQIVEAVPTLMIAAADSDSKVRSSALQRLGKLGAPAEVPALLKLLLGATDEQDINGLARALSSICTRAGSSATTTDQLIGALTGASPKQKAALLGVLGAVGGEKSLASVRASLSDPDAIVKESAVSALAEWPDSSAAPDLLQLARSEKNSSQRVLALRSYVKLVRESGATDTEKLKLLNNAAPLATSPQDKMLVLAGLGDILSVESLRLVIPHLSDPAIADQAGAVAVKIAEKLKAKDSADIGTALNQVLKFAKSPQVLDKARNRMGQLKLPVQ